MYSDSSAINTMGASVTDRYFNGRGGLRPSQPGDENWQPEDWDETDLDPLANFYSEDESEEPFALKNSGLTSDIIRRIRDVTEDWPRSVAGTLFVDAPTTGVHYFDKQPVEGLFGWLGAQHPIHWMKNGPTKGEVFAELRRTAIQYAGIELLPHEPLIEGTYYRGKVPEPGAGFYLKWLVDRFCPETTIDRDLIKAAFITPFWGGPPGKRPIFTITSDAGRGVGKTTLGGVY